MNFSDNVVVAETCYQMSQVLSFSNLERAYNVTSFNKNIRTNFSGDKKKYNDAFWGVYFLRMREKKFKLNLILVVVLVFGSKAKVFNFPM